MSNAPALEILERRLADLERKANGLIETINDLRAEDGLPPRAPLGGGDSGTRGAMRCEREIGEKNGLE